MDNKILILGGAAVAAYLLWFRRTEVQTVSNVQISPGSTGVMSVPMALQGANPTIPGASPAQGRGAAQIVAQPYDPSAGLTIGKKSVDPYALKPTPPITQTKVTPPSTSKTSKASTKPGSKMLPPKATGTPVKSLAPKPSTNPAPVKRGNTQPQSGGKKK